MDVRFGLWRKLSAEELMLLNCGVGEDSWESLGQKEIQPVHSKGDQSWVFIGRNDAKAETPVLWPPHAKSWLIGKDSDAGRGWRQEEKGMTEHEMAGWHHRLDGHEFEWTPGVGDGQGGLACCDSCKESDTTERLNWTEVKWMREQSMWIFGWEYSKQKEKHIQKPWVRTALKMLEKQQGRDCSGLVGVLLWVMGSQWEVLNSLSTG